MFDWPAFFCYVIKGIFYLLNVMGEEKDGKLMNSDTIAAIATAVSPSGIGIVRISGCEAFAVADRVYRSKSGKVRLCECESHTIQYGYICRNGQVIDEVMVLLMRAPRSYTAEDTVEIDCHGGVYVMGRILEAVIAAGARPAEPGEFTKRAFLNGRLDLTRAEAVIDVINAKNEYALRGSMDQLQGLLYGQVQKMRETLLHELALIESALDDPEHITLEGYGRQLKDTVDNLLKTVDKLLKSFENGRFFKEGVNTVIVGKPNVGKSSLLNILVGKERAIVTDVAGTTRDVIEEQINLNGITLNIMDTAGIRDTDDCVERIGVERARKSAAEADLVLYVMDASRELDGEDEAIMDLLVEKQAVVLLNKSDLQSVLTPEKIKSKINKQVLSISAKDLTGIDQLEEVIHNMFFQGELKYNDEIYAINVRQKNLLVTAKEHLKLVEHSIVCNMPEDFYSIDLMSAYEALGNMIGEAVEDDLVEEIFSKFCMGK